jgi:hypothetical protein
VPRDLDGTLDGEVAALEQRPRPPPGPGPSSSMPGEVCRKPIVVTGDSQPRRAARREREIRWNLGRRLEGPDQRRQAERAAHNAVSLPARRVGPVM